MQQWRTYSIVHLLSHTELMRVQVWSGLQVMVPLPLTCWPLGQVTRTDCPTWNSCWDPFPLLSSLQTGGAGQDLAVRNKNDGFIFEKMKAFIQLTHCICWQYTSIISDKQYVIANMADIMLGYRLYRTNVWIWDSCNRVCKLFESNETATQTMQTTTDESQTKFKHYKFHKDSIGQGTCKIALCDIVVLFLWSLNICFVSTVVSECSSDSLTLLSHCLLWNRWWNLVMLQRIVSGVFACTVRSMCCKRLPTGREFVKKSNCCTSDHVDKL